jgi:hypothetical protein
LQVVLRVELREREMEGVRLLLPHDEVVPPHPTWSWTVLGTEIETEYFAIQRAEVAERVAQTPPPLEY